MYFKFILHFSEDADLIVTWLMSKSLVAPIIANGLVASWDKRRLI